MTDLNMLSATELAAGIAAKTFSPVEVMDAALTRMERVQPAFNPFCLILADEARAGAVEAENAVMRGDDLGPMHGLPVAFKDFTPTKGHRTTRGSYCFENWVPDWDPVIVQRFKAAGAIVAAKTTTPEFANSSFCRSPLWGHTLNPWDPTKTSGGSSGGSGVAVTTGCVSLAEGTDMGGSVRIPAALCGIVGLKPSLGRIPMDILATQFDDMSHFGPLTRTVDDAALFLRVAEGPTNADINSQVAPLPLPKVLPRDVRGLRLALSPDLGYFAVDPEVEANLRNVAQALADAGAIVEEVDLPWTPEVTTVWWEWWTVYQAAAFGDLLPEYRDKMDPAVVDMLEAGLAMNAVDFKRIENIRTTHWQSFAPILDRYDAFLCPSMALPAANFDALDSEFERIDAAGRFHGFDMTSPFNNIGQCPALSVPSGMTGGGLPTSIQIVGRRYDDPTVLRVGAAIEELVPWQEWSSPI